MADPTSHWTSWATTYPEAASELIQTLRLEIHEGLDVEAEDYAEWVIQQIETAAVGTRIDVFRSGNTVHVRVTLPDGRQGEASGHSELHAKDEARAKALSKKRPP